MPGQPPTDSSAVGTSEATRTRGDEDLRRLVRGGRGRPRAGLAADFRSSKYQIGENHVLHCQRHHSRRCRPPPCRDGWPAACRAGGVAPNLATASVDYAREAGTKCASPYGPSGGFTSQPTPQREKSRNESSLQRSTREIVRWWCARRPGPRRVGGGCGRHRAQRGPAHAVQGAARVGVRPPVVLVGVLPRAGGGDAPGRPSGRPLRPQEGPPRLLGPLRGRIRRRVPIRHRWASSWPPGC